MIFLFFFMEETNYVRGHAEPTNDSNSPNISSHGEDPEKAAAASTHPGPATESGAVYTKKSYVKKLSLLGPKQTRNTMLRRLWQTLYYLSWPVIFYAGYAIRFPHFLNLANLFEAFLTALILFYSIS